LNYPKKHQNDPINGFFASNLDDFMQKQPKMPKFLNIIIPISPPLFLTEMQPVHYKKCFTNPTPWFKTNED
jgi:hypothetical protein